MAHPKTAIIVLSYNGVDITKKFLKHLYDFTENFLLVMIDNGSTDGSASYLGEFAAEHDNVVFVANDTNLGVICGRNYGYDVYRRLLDRPQYLCFLDNDQFVQPGWLSHHFKVMEQSKAQIVGVEAWLMNSNFRPIHQCKHTGDPFTYIGCGGTLMSSEVTDTIGMFDPQFNPCYFEDPDFCFRAVDAGFRLAWNSRAKLIHLPHQTLGKNPRRAQNFQSSHQKFCAKWKRRRVFPQRQPLVEALQ